MALALNNLKRVDRVDNKETKPITFSFVTVSTNYALQIQQQTLKPSVTR